jgi:hypothetical protein
VSSVTRKLTDSGETLSRIFGVKFSEPPREMPWGTQAVFKDLYGNSYALVQSRAVSANQ